MSKIENPPSIWIICSGCDSVRRGYETHARLLFTSLKDENEYTIKLIKGTGKRTDNERPMYLAPTRRSWIVRLLGKIRGGVLYWESIFMALNVMVTSWFSRSYPSHIYTQEPMTIKTLWKVRALLRGKPILIFCHGVNNQPKEYVPFAHIVQEVNIENYDRSKNSYPSSDIRIIPHFLDQKTPQKVNIRQVKSDFGITSEINVISVGVIDKETKRMDYLIDEISLLPEEYGLILCGQGDQRIIDYGQKKLGSRFTHLYVRQTEMDTIYGVSDIFVLGSLNEGFGIVLLEAMRNRLPVITHDRKLFQWITSKSDTCIDLTKKGSLAGLIESKTPSEWQEARNVSYENFNNRFTWGSVKEDYLSLFRSK